METGQSAALNFNVKPALSILIPTYNRSQGLKRTLAAIIANSMDASQYEVVVVDDASIDNTRGFLSTFASETNIQFQYIVLQKNGGPARARNVGLSFVRGNIVLNLGDDIEVSPELLNQHLKWHQHHPDERNALLGRVAFPDALEPNTFMKWLETGGRKFFFDYASLTPGRPVPPTHFYTCNVSVKRSLLNKAGRFDESFPFASHEDLELGARLDKIGMRLVYDPETMGYHWHYLNIEGIARRVYLMGYSANLYWKKVGQNDDHVLRRTARNAIAAATSAPWMIYCWNVLRKKTYCRSKVYPLHWHVLLSLSFFIGLSDARNGTSRPY